MKLDSETPFEVWLIAQQFEANLHENCLREKWNGLYFLASEKQVNYGLSVLERLILPDEVEKGYRLKIQNASGEYCKKIIDELLQEFDRQTAVFNPQKQFIYHCNLP